jgi:hypothetical protein
MKPAALNSFTIISQTETDPQQGNFFPIILKKQDIMFSVKFKASPFIQSLRRPARFSRTGQAQIKNIKTLNTITMLARLLSLTSKD